MKNERNSNNLIILVIALSLLAICLLGYIVYNKILNNKETTQAEFTNSSSGDYIYDKEKEFDNKQVTYDVLDSLIGEWGFCDGEYNCRGIIISKNNDKYIYTPFIMWAGGRAGGEVKSVSKIGNNEYEITVYFAAYENEESSAPEQTIKYNVDTTKVTEERLYVDDYKYQKVIGDREIFFENLMKKSTSN